jgi:two-component system sensor histidine kinase PilS (NtrC family)
MATTEQTLPSHSQFRGSLSESTRAMAPEASRRVLRLVGSFRCIVGLLLIVVVAFSPAEPLLGARYPELYLATAILYTALAAVFLIHQASRPIPGPMRIPLQLAVDILCVTVLMHASGGVRSGLGALLVVFVGAASLSLPGRHAFFAAAVATFAVLGEQMTAAMQNLADVNGFLPAGVLGAIIFTIASAAYPLARRLEESEALAHQRGIDLANLAQLNEYIVQNLRESIVVVDVADNIRLINQPAIEQLASHSRATGQPLSSVSPELHRLLVQWRHDHDPRGATPSFVTADGTSQINTYIAPLDGRRDGAVLIFLEDAAALAEKVQQSKLAALGRLTASIAHEIRNPVGAMSHAGQLLQESPGIGAQEQRLLDIIDTNSRRVSDIVENILQLSRREATRPQLIALRPWVHSFIAEFVSTLELFENQVHAGPGEDVEVRMDPGHLHQIVWNLCENAAKYGSESAGGIAVELYWGRMAGSRRPYLEVADRGPGVADELRDRVFEPFATTRSGGTGLGLFISRELAECNRAALTYESRRGGGSVFRIVFADPVRWGA